MRSQEIIKEGDDLSAQWAIIQGAADEANVSRYSYLPWSQSSNTWVMEAIARAGLSRPSGVATDINGDLNTYWAPGSDKRLTTPQNEDVTAQPMSYLYASGPEATTVFSAALPFADAGRTMPPSDPGALPGAPSVAAGQSGWLLNPIDQGGLLPNSSLEARQRRHPARAGRSGSEDTTANVAIAITGQLAAAGETVTLEAYVVELMSRI